MAILADLSPTLVDALRALGAQPALIGAVGRLAEPALKYRESAP
jgi:hypothetical protein